MTPTNSEKDMGRLHVENLLRAPSREPPEFTFDGGYISLANGEGGGGGRGHISVATVLIFERA